MVSGLLYIVLYYNEMYGYFTLNVVLRMWIMGAVMRPQEKNWRKTATTA